MSGGTITMRPPEELRYVPADNAILGNCALYGATGGQFFANGRAGDRFAVRNSGATAVIEGVGMHACEYMTLGTVVILGTTGANLGAGMTGGMVFVRRDQESNLNREYVTPRELDADHLELLRDLLSSHTKATGSDVARELLEARDELHTVFVACSPNEVAGAGDDQRRPENPAILETRS